MPPRYVGLIEHIPIALKLPEGMLDCKRQYISMGEDTFQGENLRENRAVPPFVRAGILILYRWEQEEDLSFELEIWVSCSTAHLGICRKSFHDGNRASILPYSNASVFPANAHQGTTLQVQ